MKFAGVIVLVTLIGTSALGCSSNGTLPSYTDQSGGNVGSSKRQRAARASSSRSRT